MPDDTVHEKKNDDLKYKKFLSTMWMLKNRFDAHIGVVIMSALYNTLIHSPHTFFLLIGWLYFMIIF